MSLHVEKENPIQPGTVFRYIGAGSEDMETGQLCLFEKETTSGGKPVARLFTYRKNHTNSIFIDFDDFKRDFCLEPGENVLDEEIKILFREGLGIKAEIENLNETVENFSEVTRGGALPNLSAEENRLLGGGNVQNIEPAGRKDLTVEANAVDGAAAGGADESQTALRVIDNPITLARSVGAEVAGYRNLLNDKKNALAQIKRRVEQLQKLKENQIELMLYFRDLGEKIEKVLTTIKLYLGTGEEIVQIRHGAWASAETKLSIRQLVLWMDVESLILADEGGMDFKNVQQFDEWLMSDPRHLQQILPEEKGIVCLKPRKARKEYSKDKFIDDLVNARNVQTYILIRHGENLFRVTPDWEVGSRLFPSRHEFEKFFRAERFNYTTREREHYVITPESGEFERAVEKMDAANFHYRNTLVLLQGIIDRTGIFKDLQERGVNLLDIRQNAEEIVYINDGDENYLLRDGRETFREYQARLNAQLNVGNRVILGRYTDGSARQDKRIYPKNAEYPDIGKLYLLEKGSDGDFVIRYERTERIYAHSWSRGFHSKEPERRASFRLYRNDKFILAYDLASAEEMDDFINDRLSRDAYLDLLPLLKTIRKLKLEEEQEEEQFLLMLVGELLKRQPEGKPEDLRREARRLINWWKFRNRYHRALKDDYAKAFRMIMKEYELEEKTGDAVLNGEIAGWEELLTPETLFIGRQKRQLVRFERADNFGTLLTQTNFSCEKQGFKQTRRKESFIMRRDLLNTEQLYAHDDWHKWLYGYEVKANYVSEQEAGVFLAMLGYAHSPLNQELERQLKNVANRTFHYERGNRVLTKTLPLAVLVKGVRLVVAYYVNYTNDGDLVEKSRPHIYTFEFVDGKNSGFDYVTYTYNVCELKKIDEYLTATAAGSWFPKLEERHVIKLFSENFAEIREDYLVSEARRRHIDDIYAMTKSAVEELREQINQELESRAKKQYLASYGDERNWEYYKKKANIDYVSWDEIKIVSQILGDFRLICDDAGEMLRGKTLSEIKDIITRGARENRFREAGDFPERLFALGYGAHVFFPLEPEPGGGETVRN